MGTETETGASISQEYGKENGQMRESVRACVYDRMFVFECSRGGEDSTRNTEESRAICDGARANGRREKQSVTALTIVHESTVSFVRGSKLAFVG